jgi:hypothetical protein
MLLTLRQFFEISFFEFDVGGFALLFVVIRGIVSSIISKLMIKFTFNQAISFFSSIFAVVTSFLIASEESEKYSFFNPS